MEGATGASAVPADVGTSMVLTILLIGAAALALGFRVLGCSCWQNIADECKAYDRLDELTQVGQIISMRARPRLELVKSRSVAEGHTKSNRRPLVMYE